MKYIPLLPVLALLLCACGAPAEQAPSSDEALPPVQSDISADPTISDSTASETTSEPPTEPTIPDNTAPEATPEDADFVRVTDYIPTIEVDLKYATKDNFTDSVIYDFSDAYLRYGTVKKLQTVTDIIAADGYSLKIWDAFRPTQAQFKLWEICPDPVYVSNPNKGFSSHSRGNTLDVTLIHTDGSAVEMPTDFDDFSALADRDYSDVPESAAANARYLESVMKEQGFKPYQGEWWHFSDTDTYEVDSSFQPPQS